MHGGVVRAEVFLEGFELLLEVGFFSGVGFGGELFFEKFHRLRVALHYVEVALEVRVFLGGFKFADEHIGCVADFCGIADFLLRKCAERRRRVPML